MKNEKIKKGIKITFYILATLGNILTLCILPSALAANLAGERIIRTIGKEKMGLILNNGIILLLFIGAIGYFIVLLHLWLLAENWKDEHSQLETMYVEYEQLCKHNIVVVIKKDKDILKGLLEQISKEGILLRENKEGNMTYIPLCDIVTLKKEERI